MRVSLMKGVYDYSWKESSKIVWEVNISLIAVSRHVVMEFWALLIIPLKPVSVYVNSCVIVLHSDNSVSQCHLAFFFVVKHRCSTIWQNTSRQQSDIYHNVLAQEPAVNCLMSPKSVLVFIILFHSALSSLASAGCTKVCLSNDWILKWKDGQNLVAHLCFLN